MGQDVYLQRFENYDISQRLRAEYERRMDRAWLQIANRGNNYQVSKQDEEIYARGRTLAYVLNTREEQAFLKLKSLLQPFGIQHFYTDGCGMYERHLNGSQHTIGKRYTQKIERKHLNYRTRIKRLARKQFVCPSLS